LGCSIKVFCDSVCLSESFLVEGQMLAYTLLSYCVVVSKSMMWGWPGVVLADTSIGKSASRTPPTVWPQAVKVIISVFENPCFRKLSVRVSRSCWGSGVPNPPGVHASIRPPRNGTMGPPQVATAKTPPRAMMSAPTIMVNNFHRWD